MDERDTGIDLNIIENDIVDKVHIGNELFLKPFPEFILHLLHTYEIEILLKAGNCKRKWGVADKSFYIFLTDITSGVNQCVKWAYSLCPQANDYDPFPNIKDIDIDSFLYLMGMGTRYSDLSVYFTSYHRKRINFESFSGGKLIRFYESESELLHTRYSIWKEEKKQNRLAFDFIHCVKDDSIGRSQEVFENTSIEHNFEYGLYYPDQTDEEFRDALVPYCSQSDTWWMNSTEYPEEWVFEEFSYIEYKEFIKNLVAYILYVNELSRMPHWTNNLDRRFIPVIWLMPENFHAILEKIGSNITQNKVNKFFEILTFDPQIKQSSLSEQPLINLNGLWFTTPHLLTSVNASEALMFYLHRKKDKKLFAVVDEKEMTQCKVLREIIGDRSDIFCKQNLILPDSLPDIDLAICDTKNNCILAIQLKWFSGISSTSKLFSLLENDVLYGIQQCDKIMNHINSISAFDCSQLFSRNDGICGGRFTADKNTKYFGLVVITGLSDYISQSHPVINFDTFTELLQKKKMNMKDVIDSIKSEEYLLNEYDNMMESFIPIEYGGIQFETPALCPPYKIGRNEPCPCGKRDENGRRRKYKTCCGKIK